MKKPSMRKNSKSNIRTTIFVPCLVIGVFISGLISAERTERRGLPNLLERTYIPDTGHFDGNRIYDDLENNGMFVSHRISGHSGMEWPKGTNLYINFASGIWIAGKVGSDIRTAVAEYGPEFVAGPWGSDANAIEHQLYIVNKSDLADPLANEDFQNWPVDLGAPWVDEDGDGVYTPMPFGEDHPEFIGDQVIWYVMNDGDVAEHGNIFGTLPLGIEVQMTIWGYDRPDAFGDMMFVKALIINKGGNDIDDTFIGLWSDPDLGDAGDDFVGCDTTLSLGFCYNDGADADYGGNPPAIGYDFFQGPIVPSVGDTAFAFGQYIPDYKNLPMSSFSKYINIADSDWSDPNTAEEAYNLMQGLHKDGSPFINSETGEPTKFVYSDDPNDNTGFGDGIWVDSDDHPSGDRRFLMNSGPFTLADGDSQEIVFGILIARGSDALSSITVLKEVDELAQLAYDIQFANPESPPVINVNVTALPEEIILTWDDIAESYTAVDMIDQLPVPVAFDSTWNTVYLDSAGLADETGYYVILDTIITDDLTLYHVQILTAIDTTFQGEYTNYIFEGYNVYQFDNPFGTGEKKRIATYDLINGVTEIYDDVFDPELGEVINKRVQFGSDSGVRRHIQIATDAFNNGSPLVNNTEYYFGVIAYGYNPYGIPKTLESTFLPLSAIPIGAVSGVDYSEVWADSAEHISGGGDGTVFVEVVDPSIVTGHTYKVTFRQNEDSTAIVWDITDTTINELVYSGCPIQSGIDMESGDDVGVDANPIVEGLQIAVSGPPNEFKDFYVTENAGGPIDGYAGASADYNGYPGMGRDNIENQQTDGSMWFISTSNGYNIAYEDFFPYVTRYSGGYGNPNGGMQYLIPDDFEFHFTATGSKMLNRVTGLVVDTPLEIWNVGDVTDPSDDFQLMGIFNDSDENGEWNLYQDDSPLSGGTNDPYMETFYVLEHMDREPGTAGYEDMVAALTADPDASGPYIWATGPGLPLSVEGQITRVVLLNMTFVEWNGGDVEDADWPANVTSMVPETGTVFRMVTTKPITADDVFMFSTTPPLYYTISKGDVNADEEVNISDVVKLINYILQLDQLTGEQEYAADFNSDLEVNIADAVGIINNILGLSKSLAQLSDAENARISFPKQASVYNDVVNVPLTMVLDGSVAGMQIVLKYDPQLLTPLSPKFENEEWNHFNLVQNSPEEGKVIYLFYSLTGESLPVSDLPIFQFKMIKKEIEIHSEIEIVGAVISNQQGSSLEIQFGNKIISTFGIPETFALYPNYPNPFNPITNITYDLPEPSSVTIYVYNILGQRVRTLMNRKQFAGQHVIQWNGRNNMGKMLSSGVYIIDFKANNFTRRQKVMLLK